MKFDLNLVYTWLDKYGGSATVYAAALWDTRFSPFVLAWEIARRAPDDEENEARTFWDVVIENQLKYEALL